MTILFYLGVLITLFSYSWILYNRFSVRLEFIPVIVCSSLVAILYAGALLNLLPLTVWAILASGVALFALLLFRWKQGKQLKRIYKIFFSSGILITLVLVVFFASQTKNAYFFTHDDFSHWALILKQMHRTNHLPNATDTIIKFQAYPPGTAVFIYFLTYMGRLTDGTQIFAQIVFTLSCFCAPFAFVPQKSKSEHGFYKSKIFLISTIFACVTLMAITRSLISLYSLYVDALSSAIGVAGTAIVIYYKDDIKKAAYLSVPVWVATLLIKNLGVFFVLINILLLIYFANKIRKKERTGKRLQPFKPILFASLFSFSSLVLWQIHMRIAFSGAESSKHAMSLENFSDGISSKTGDAIVAIVKVFIKKTINLTENTLVRNMIFWNIALLIVVVVLILLKKSGYKRIRNALILGNSAFVFYLLFMLLMYLFSMPVKEALALASYERYLPVAYCYSVSVFMIALSRMIAQTKEVKTMLALSCIPIVLFAAGQLSKPYGIKSGFLPRAYIGTTVETLDTAFEIENVQEQTLVYAPRGSKLSDSFLLAYVKYKLYSNNFTIVREIKNKNVFLKKLKKSKYLVLIEPDDEIRDFMKDFTEKGDVQGTYTVDEVFKPLLTP